MELPIGPFIKAMWLIFTLYWLWGWRRVKGAQRKEAILPRLVKYWLPLAIAILLIGPGDWFGSTWLHARMYPASVAIAVLLDKYMRRQTTLDADYVGFQCPDYFVVGYGMDVAHAFRELPFVGIVKGDA